MPGLLKAIKYFVGEYRFLSNFYICPVKYGNLRYPSAEHAFQAAKTLNADDRRMIHSACSPAIAKKWGRTIRLRADWDVIKDGIMYDIVYAKFSQNDRLRNMLLATDNAVLEEGNTWGDMYWGTVRGIGRNQLGLTLMQVRKVLRKERR